MKIPSALRLCVAIFPCLYAQFAVGDDIFYAGYEQGDFKLDGINGLEPEFSSIAVGVTNNQYTLQLNGYEFDNVGETDNTYRGIDGYSLRIGKVFLLSSLLELEVAYGRLWWETRDVVNNIHIGEQSGADRLLEAKITINFDRFGLYVGRREISDIAGGDLDMTTAGLRYLFK